jgi:hypothetical protein
LTEITPFRTQSDDPSIDYYDDDQSSIYFDYYDDMEDSNTDEFPNNNKITIEFRRNNDIRLKRQECKFKRMLKVLGCIKPNHKLPKRIKLAKKQQRVRARRQMKSNGEL